MLLCISSLCCLDMTCCVSMLGTGEGNPWSYWGQQRFFIDKLRFRWCCKENEAFVVLLLVSQSLLFPISCSRLLLRFIRFEEFQGMDKDLKDIIILQILNMGRWLRLYSRKSTLVLGSREFVGAGGLMKGNILLLFEQLEKLQLELSSILRATECNSETKPQATRLSNFSASETMCFLFCSLLSNASSKKKKGNNNMVDTVIWGSRCH